MSDKLLSNIKGKGKGFPSPVQSSPTLGDSVHLHFLDKEAMLSKETETVQNVLGLATMVNCFAKLNKNW